MADPSSSSSARYKALNIDVSLLERVSCLWRGQDSQSFDLDVVESYAENFPLLLMGFPPVLVRDPRRYEQVLRNKRPELLSALRSRPSVPSHGQQLSIESLTFLIACVQRVRRVALERYVHSHDKDLGEIIHKAAPAIEVLVDARQQNCRQKFDGSTQNGDGHVMGEVFLELAWACIEPQHTELPTPSTTAPENGSLFDAVGQVLDRNLPFTQSCNRILELVRCNTRPNDDIHTGNAIQFAFSVYRTRLGGGLPVPVRAMFIEGSRNCNVGTVHRIFLTATETHGVGEHRVHHPQAWSSESAKQIEDVVHAVTETYLRKEGTYEVTVSIDDLPGGTNSDMPLEGQSLGLAVAVGLASKLSGQTVEQDMALTGQLRLGCGVPFLVGDVGGVALKVAGAEASGIQRVVVPRGNEAEARSASDHCEVWSVGSFTDLVSRIWVFEKHAEHLFCGRKGRDAPILLPRDKTLGDFFSKGLYRPQKIARIHEGMADRECAVPLSNLLSDDSLPSQIILFGGGGLGKTSALLNLMYQAKSNPVMIPWYARMREYLEGDDAIDSVCCTLATEGPREPEFSGASLRCTLEDTNCPSLLILLDALNEQSAVKQILIAKSLKACCAWVENLNRKRAKGKGHRVILAYRKEPYVRSLVIDSLLLDSGVEYELMELSVDEVTTYLERAHVHESLLHLLSEEIRELLCIPLILRLVEELTSLIGPGRQEELRQIRNKAQLYGAVIRLWLRREWWDNERKIFPQPKEFMPLTGESLERCVDFHAKALGEIAHEMTEMGVEDLSEDEFRRVVHEFVKREFSAMCPEDFCSQGPWHWVRQHLTVMNIPECARKNSNSKEFREFVDKMSRSLLESTVLQNIRLS